MDASAILAVVSVAFFTGWAIGANIVARASDRRDRRRTQPRDARGRFKSRKQALAMPPLNFAPRSAQEEAESAERRKVLAHMNKPALRAMHNEAAARVRGSV